MPIGQYLRGLGLVVTIHSGGPVTGDNVRKHDLARFIGKAGVRTLRIHDVRCYASTLKAAGAPLKSASELTGHSGTSTAADIKDRLRTEAKREATTALDRVPPAQRA